MKTYEIKTVYREVSFGECWVTVKAESEEAAIAQAAKGEFELDNLKTGDVESFDLNMESVYWVKEVAEA